MYIAVRRLLQTPFPLPLCARTNAAVALSLGAFSWAFLQFYQPFGIATLPDGPNREGFLAGFGLGMTTVYATVTVGGSRLLPRFFSEKTWTIGREIAKSAVLIALLGAVFWGNARLFGHAAASLTDFLRFQALTWAGSVLPVAGLTLWKLLATARRRLRERLPVSDEILLFQGDSAADTLRVRREAVWLLRADDNYVEVLYRDGGVFKKYVLRATLKRLETQLKPYPEFFRCHRSYLVNLGKVGRVRGQAPNQYLELADFPEPVPVARGQARTVLARLHAGATGDSSATRLDAVGRRR